MRWGNNSPRKFGYRAFGLQVRVSAVGLVVCALFFLAAGMPSCSGSAMPAPPALPTTRTPTILPTSTPTRPPATSTRALVPTAKPSNTPAVQPTRTHTATSRGPTETARVVRVIDGDTIVVEIGGQTYRLRYIGIDAPEPDQPHGPEAAEQNAAMVSGRIVELEKDVSEVDQYGRLLRYVWIGDMMVNRELVCQGYATAATYPPDVKYQALFLQCEREAREAGRGFWGAKPTSAPQQSGPCPYIGNRSSKVFHYAWCSSVAQMNPANKVCFATKEEALAQGYRPCKNCRP